MDVLENECKKAGLDYAQVLKIAKGLSRYGRQAENLGITIFGGSGSGSLRFDDQRGEKGGRSLVVAFLDGRYDGGDGGCDELVDGYMRGE